jgi:uncharacterized membrane protein
VQRFQRWLVTGIVLLAPAYVTGVVLVWLFRLVDSPIHKLVQRWTGLSIPGVGVVATLLIVLLAGAVASTYMMRNFVRWLEWSLQQVPVARTIYSAIKQLLSPFEGEGSQFSRVVMVEAPSPGFWSLGFLVNQNAARAPDGALLAAVLLPSNHLHLGNIVLVPVDRMHATDMSIEEGLKFLVSMGAALEQPLRFGTPSGPGLRSGEVEQ